MHTQLGTYRQQFDQTLRPVLADVDAALRALEAAPAELPGKRLFGPLSEVRRELAVLCDKVSEQQAYVLIFGPLKSGKSTLMNAIAATYVSEVSSLPAYPCLVFVGPGAAREYVVTGYDGRRQTFRDPEELHRHIDGAHTDLAAAIREAEARGETFDPQEHFPAAIRRVDVSVPDSQLATAVLVDTPGLYTRMRFGYDRMTRDFRNAAACAIFVVKSDTLFLEQVFAEFQQLLDLFSRIFLVVNVDSHKRDLSPDGKLVPSLEQSRPTAVLDAFEKLAMSAPLQAAAKEGRVRMYPVDLLQAASTVLQKQEPERVPDSFRAFRKDLAEYLASSDYLTALLRDSLQRGHNLLGDAAAAAASDDVGALSTRLHEVEADLRAVEAEQQRLAEFAGLDWAQAFARSRGEIEDEVERSARDGGAKLVRMLGASIDTWILSSHSLDWLVSGQWTPMVGDYREDVLAAGRRVLEQQLGQRGAGLELPEEASELLRRAGVDVRVCRAQAFANLGAVEWTGDDTVQVDLAAIPIRKGVLDRLAFRSLERVRDRLFGPAERPDAKIQAKDKAARLGEPGRLHLHQCVMRFRGELAPQTVKALRRFFGSDLRNATVELVQRELEAYGPRLQQRHEVLQAQRTRLLAVTEPMERLGVVADAIQTKLQALGKEFHQEFADAVADGQPQPAPAQDPVLMPMPRREREEQAPASRRESRPTHRTR
jgi:hypothetical protein